MVYSFHGGNAKLRALLGGKGADLAEMTRIGLPVPLGITITTEVCKEFIRAGGKIPEGLMEEVIQKLRDVEKVMGRKFGDSVNPLLVSVRSGAPISMPGMMDTVLNLGLNDMTVLGLVKQSNDERFAYDCFRRFIQMFGKVVLDIKHEKFEEIIDEQKSKRGVKLDVDLSTDDLKEIVHRYKQLVKREIEKDFPQDPLDQLKAAIVAVFNSWNSPRAQVYRKLNKISEDLGTAVNIQAMVFGNFGKDSATGVAFTRNPSTGERKLYGEYLPNAQGEDVVAGIRTPRTMDEMQKEFPDAYKELSKICALLEKHFRDMQDVEFTIQNGRLFMLQTRSGKRTAQAAVRIAVEMFGEGLISKKEALMRVQPNQLDQLLHRRIDPSAKIQAIATGLPASPGAASGKVIFDVDEAEKLGNLGEKIILVRSETTPEDIHGMAAAAGVLTSRGGMTSHAAVVARGMGKPCVAGCESIKVDLSAELFQAGNFIIKKGDLITIDGGTGKVILGEVPLIDPELGTELKQLLSWADEIRVLRVRANADTSETSARARSFGAEGIGLCRTERMFNAVDRLPIVQEMILAEDSQQRGKALQKLLPVQRGDFKEIFRVMEGLPVTIRLLDLPLHEFLPKFEDLLEEVLTLRARGDSSLHEKERVLKKVTELREHNPMLGHRGCRLAISHPEIYEMQTRAIFEAATELMKTGIKVYPEVMLPLVGHINELATLKERIINVANQVMSEAGIKVDYLIGTMIEVPRAALTADEIATEAQFFSFGTNDLTQTTWGYSRDDAEGKFIHEYLAKKILPTNPFEVLDRKGVGRIMIMAVDYGRKTRNDLKIGICGEHGGEPSSVEFCRSIGLDYVSCSSFRVPIARLAAAQAEIKTTEKTINE